MKNINYSPVFSRSLAGIFTRLDPDWKIEKQCQTGSYYLSVGELKIRVSDHFKKDIEKDQVSDVDLIKPLKARTYITGIKGSVFYVHTPLKVLESFLRTELARKTMFHRTSPSDFYKSGNTASAAPGEYIPEYPELVRLCREYVSGHPNKKAELDKYLLIKNTLELGRINRPLFGSAIAMIYDILGIKYQKHDHRIWLSVPGTFYDLMAEIQRTLKKTPEKIHNK